MVKYQILGINIIGFFQTEGDDFYGRLNLNTITICVVSVDDETAFGMNVMSKFGERILNVGQILEKIQMVGIDVEDNGGIRVEIPKRITVKNIFLIVSVLPPYKSTVNNLSPIIFKYTHDFIPAITVLNNK